MTEADKYTNPALEDRSLFYLRNHLASLFGPGWNEFEIEIWVSEFAPSSVTPLLIAKLRLLRAMEEDPDRFYDDIIFMMHAIDILNGDMPDSDLDVLPQITSLELVYGLLHMMELYPPSKEVSLEAARTLARLTLEDDGFDFIPKGLDGVLKPGDLQEHEFTVASDRKNKQQALDTYLKLMRMTDR